MPRDTLTREQIVRAAVELLDTEGLEGLNMRSLGARLGSAATAVYWHVKSKDNLVVLAADEVWGEIELPDLDDDVGWRTPATAMANGLHAMVTRHPWLVPAMSSHLIHGPGKARYDDHALAVYEAAGFTGSEADSALATVYLFVLGSALERASEIAWRQRVIRDGGNAEAELKDVFARVSEIATGFPRLRARLDAMDDAAPPERIFEFGLHTVLDGLESRLAARTVRSPKRGQGSKR